MDNKNTKRLTLAALIVCVVGLTVGFAAFSTSLTIKSNATVTATDANFKVGFNGTINCTGTGTATEGTASGTTWSGLKASFTAPGQTVTCRATVANTGEYDAYLTELIASAEKLSCGAATQTEDGATIPTEDQATSSLVTQACGDVTVNVTTQTTGGALLLSDHSTSAEGTVGTTTLKKLTGTEDVIITITYGGSTAVDGPWNITIPSIKLTYATAKGITGGSFPESTTKCEVVDTTNVSTEAIYNTGMIGNKVKCGSEYFYIIPDHSQAPAGTVSLLAENNITLEATPTQSSTAGNLAFSNNAYWENSNYYALKNGFVYDSNSNLHTYVEAYKNSIISNGTNVIDAYIPDHQQMMSLGCRVDEYGGTCDYAEPWVYSSSYWTGTVPMTDVKDEGMLYAVLDSSQNYSGRSWYAPIRYYESIGIRPVIIVSESDIVS